MTTPDVAFPHLGIEIQRLNRIAFNVFGMDINWYGVFIAIGILLGAVVAFRNTKHTGISNDMFMDFILIAVPVAIVFTRLYYVAFNFDIYKDNLWKIFAFRDGGMGVYGGIISAVITCYIFAKVRKVSMGAIGDTGVLGLLIGQMIGRLGNLVNQEAFGKYTDSLFAMQYKLSGVSSTHVTPEMMQNLVYRSGEMYIQVHPTFLYEIALNGCIFILLWIYRKRKKFQGELLLLYMIIYALGRFFIESLRTDQLFLWGTGVPISMLVSGVIFLAGVGFYVYKLLNIRKNGTPPASTDV